MREGLVAIGVFLIAIGVLTFYVGSVLGGGDYLGFMNMHPLPYGYSNYMWWFVAEIAGGVLAALGLSTTVYGALKKG